MSELNDKIVIAKRKAVNFTNHPLKVSIQNHYMWLTKAEWSPIILGWLQETSAMFTRWTSVTNSHLGQISVLLLRDTPRDREAGQAAQCHTSWEQGQQVRDRVASRGKKSNPEPLSAMEENPWIIWAKVTLPVRSAGSDNRASRARQL